MIKRKSITKTDKNGETYEYYTAKPRMKLLRDKYYISFHDKIFSCRIWSDCIQMYNNYVAFHYVTRENLLQSYTAPFIDLDTPAPDVETWYDNSKHSILPVKRCRTCDRWFHRAKLHRESKKCPQCHAGHPYPDINTWQYLKCDGEGEDWEFINAKTCKKLKKCGRCGKEGDPKRLNSPKFPIRHHKLCPDCWRGAVFKRF